jgi:hypothetical protein
MSDEPETPSPDLETSDPKSDDPVEIGNDVEDPEPKPETEEQPEAGSRPTSAKEVCCHACIREY